MSQQTRKRLRSTQTHALSSILKSPDRKSSSSLARSNIRGGSISTATAASNAPPHTHNERREKITSTTTPVNGVGGQQIQNTERTAREMTGRKKEMMKPYARPVKVSAIPRIKETIGGFWSRIAEWVKIGYTTQPPQESPPKQTQYNEQHKDHEDESEEEEQQIPAPTNNLPTIQADQFKSMLAKPSLLPNTQSIDQFTLPSHNSIRTSTVEERRNIPSTDLYRRPTTRSDQFVSMIRPGQMRRMGFTLPPTRIESRTEAPPASSQKPRTPLKRPHSNDHIQQRQQPTPSSHGTDRRSQPNTNQAMDEDSEDDDPKPPVINTSTPKQKTRLPNIAYTPRRPDDILSESNTKAAILSKLRHRSSQLKNDIDYSGFGLSPFKEPPSILKMRLFSNSPSVDTKDTSQSSTGAKEQPSETPDHQKEANNDTLYRSAVDSNAIGKKTETKSAPNFGQPIPGDPLRNPFAPAANKAASIPPKFSFEPQTNVDPGEEASTSQSEAALKPFAIRDSDKPKSPPAPFSFPMPTPAAPTTPNPFAGGFKAKSLDQPSDVPAPNFGFPVFNAAKISDYNTTIPLAKPPFGFNVSSASKPSGTGDQQTTSSAAPVTTQPLQQTAPAPTEAPTFQFAPFTAPTVPAPAPSKPPQASVPEPKPAPAAVSNFGFSPLQPANPSQASLLSTRADEVGSPGAMAIDTDTPPLTAKGVTPPMFGNNTPTPAAPVPMAAPGSVQANPPFVFQAPGNPFGNAGTSAPAVPATNTPQYNSPLPPVAVSNPFGNAPAPNNPFQSMRAQPEPFKIPPATNVAPTPAPAAPTFQFGAQSTASTFGAPPSNAFGMNAPVPQTSGFNIPTSAPTSNPFAQPPTTTAPTPPTFNFASAAAPNGAPFKFATTQSPAPSSSPFAFGGAGISPAFNAGSSPAFNAGSSENTGFNAGAGSSGMQPPRKILQPKTRRRN